MTIGTLTAYQKNFLLNYFFKKEAYPGWYQIAMDLLEKGECLVSGEECIWKGGIGNFIKTEKPTTPVYDCILYKFDPSFFNSAWYKETLNNYIALLTEKKAALDQELQEITK